VDLAETVDTYSEWLAAQKKIKAPSATAFEEARIRKMAVNALQAELMAAYLTRTLLGQSRLGTGPWQYDLSAARNMDTRVSTRQKTKASSRCFFDTRVKI
jgi:hypothetical protein